MSYRHCRGAIHNLIGTTGSGSVGTSFVQVDDVVVLDVWQRWTRRSADVSGCH